MTRQHLTYCLWLLTLVLAMLFIYLESVKLPSFPQAAIDVLGYGFSGGVFFATWMTIKNTLEIFKKNLGNSSKYRLVAILLVVVLSVVLPLCFVVFLIFFDWVVQLFLNS